jgi:hypothetical protein
MGKVDRLDKDRAVGNFLANLDSLSRLPLITDAEIAHLYGADLAAALAELDFINLQEKLCQNCLKRCCQLVGCELYDTVLALCPIHHFRPLLCRMHFCTKYPSVYDPLITILGDIFLESVLAAERIDLARARFFDSPPLGRFIPALTESISTLIKTVREGKLDNEAAKSKIRLLYS